MALKTRIITIHPELIELHKLKIITRVLGKDGIIAYPTDTFYGLGACCFSKKAVLNIYRIKKRTPSKPLPVIISDIQMVQDIAVDVPSLFQGLTAEFWPGPLTVILKASSKLPKDLLGPQDSIGIRLPALSWLRELVSQVQSPLTATSANISGEKEIHSVEKVKQDFYEKVDLIVDGGDVKNILPSTVIDLTESKPKILRGGAVPHSRLEKYLE